MNEGENGFSVVEDRLNQTKNSTDTLAYFMKERASIEEMYASKLQQLLKNVPSLAEYGTTRDAWLTMRTETENTINNSKQLATSLINECYTPLSKFKDIQQKARRPYLADAWKVNKEQEKRKGNYQKSKEKYEKYHMETEKAQRSLETAKSKNDKPANELLKLTGKVQKLAKETMILEKETKEAAQKLAEYQSILADKITSVYEFLQHQEEERLEFIKTHLTKFVNSMSVSATYLPLSCQRMEEKILAIDKEWDINCFIIDKQTSTERPKPSDIVFTPIRSTISEVISGTESYDSEESPAEQHMAHSSYNENAESETQEVQVIGECRALYDYVGQDSHELDFFVGDIIRVIEKDDTGWWTGELNGRTGLFPSNYVEEVQ